MKRYNIWLNLDFLVHQRIIRQPIGSPLFYFLTQKRHDHFRKNQERQVIGLILQNIVILNLGAAIIYV